MTKNPFKRVVVLMMENHSFDNLLGWVPGVGKLTGQEKQFDTFTQKWYNVGKISDPGTANFPFDPNHDFKDVVNQLYGINCDTNSPPGQIPSDVLPLGNWYLENNHANNLDNPNFDVNTFLNCYTPIQVPVLTALSQNYTTCARWFSSLPGPTGPNRLFAHCASSGGYTGEYYNYNPQNPGSFAPPMNSIFNSLEENNKTWAIFWDKQFSSARALAQIQPYVDSNFHDLEIFKIAAAEGTLPDYVFITPSLNGRTTPTKIAPNSMHPDAPLPSNPDKGGSVANGEQLIKDVYNALASNQKVWEETLFLITFDEHGGFYDSVSPPLSLPQSMMPTNEPSWISPPQDNVPGFGFMNYGPRVPAIVISAWHKNFVDEITIFEHSAIPATVKDVFGLSDFLTTRDANSPCFNNAWDLLPAPKKPIKLP